MNRGTRRSLVAMAAVAAVGGLSAAPAAADDGGLTCRTQDGTDITCVGSVMNAVIAGPGSYRFTADDDDTCLAGNGRGSMQATLPVVTALGERTLVIEADFNYRRTAFAAISSGVADLTLSHHSLVPFGPDMHAGAGETRRFAFSSVGLSTGGGPEGCASPGSASSIEQLGFGEAASVVETGGSALPASLRRGACANGKSGTARADRLLGTRAGDLLSAAGGPDVVAGLAGHDCANGGAGADGVAGGAGHDLLSGGAAGDRLRGGPGSDELRGGPGRDTFAGGSGRDEIDARDGVAETVRCGPGRDSVEADAADRLSGCES